MAFYNQPLTGNVYFIETMGAFDGPGLRYVLFLQGCPLRCKFCHNRDSWSTETNRLMTVDEVFRNFNRYKSFYKRGGITVSGGEPTMQIDFVVALFKRFKEAGIHTCLDTSAGMFTKASEAKHLELLKYTDLVLLDIKHIDDVAHRELVGISNHQVLRFAELLHSLQVPTVIRHILLPTINDDEATLKKMRAYLDRFDNIVGIDVLPYHKAGIIKWEKMGLRYELGDINEPSQAQVDLANSILKDHYKFKK